MLGSPDREKALCSEQIAHTSSLNIDEELLVSGESPRPCDSDLCNPLPNHFDRPLPVAQGYPSRFAVPPHKQGWSQSYPEYAPCEYESPRLAEQDRTKFPDGWADPPHVSREEFLSWSESGNMHSFEGSIQHDPETGRPLNPLGRMGISGRGALGRWGPNHAADAIVTRTSPTTELLEILLIQRDSGEWAIPGGMLDRGESGYDAARRELQEETKFVLDETLGRLVYEGVGDGPRTTDNAWVETSVYHFHLKDKPDLSTQSLLASSDAKDARWFVVSPELVRTLYANHGELVEMTLTQLLEFEEDIPETVRAQLAAIPHNPLLTDFSRLKGRVGIFGGSFDPIHSEHLEVARLLKEIHSLDSVVFVPAGWNPLKATQTVASPRDRVKMLQGALSEHRGLFVSPLEARREGRSYTIDMIDMIRMQLPKEQADLFLIIGADCLQQLSKWRDYDRLLDEVELIPCSRKGYPDLTTDVDARASLSQSIGAVHAEKLLARYTKLSLPANSSTKIRELLKAGETPEGMLPGVQSFITKYRLYELSSLSE